MIGLTAAVIVAASLLAVAMVNANRGPNGGPGYGLVNFVRLAALGVVPTALSWTLWAMGRRRAVAVVAVVLIYFGAGLAGTAAFVMLARLRPLSSPEAYDTAVINATAEFRQIASIEPEWADMMRGLRPRLKAARSQAERSVIVKDCETLTEYVTANSRRLAAWPEFTRKCFDEQGVSQLRADGFMETVDPSGRLDGLLEGNKGLLARLQEIKADAEK
ncbi:MAG: hypothetical protein K2Q20_11200 [Phycisphaerales bacterium]|nr:hypothetical protein [Phycisphaerales bacterium]